MHGPAVTMLHLKDMRTHAHLQKAQAHDSHKDFILEVRIQRIFDHSCGVLDLLECDDTKRITSA